jgi:hypothetical protein
VATTEVGLSTRGLREETQTCVLIFLKSVDDIYVKTYGSQPPEKFEAKGTLWNQDCV